ncbi:hypothetical protein BLNAU_7001 [Blattamonas nauphoetae]|uniref:TmcB/TmcC TPR repeats domain-containing protein n=1 Tax=Blattamonas nauphoetae TaxID=2049346 RepID=A0ABQ9Y336_9EUKA|nr:hypothetical protein BLNAU_7001 [Blattamonas nauphoetae]
MVPRQDLLLFPLLYPLFTRPKRSQFIGPFIIHLFTFLQLLSLSFYSLTPSTTSPTLLALYISFFNLGSLPFVLKTASNIIAIVLLVLFVLVVASLFIISKTLNYLLTHQPWIITVLQLCCKLLFKLLPVPILSLTISLFDCVHNVVGIGGGIGLSFLFFWLYNKRERTIWVISISDSGAITPRFSMTSEEEKTELINHLKKHGIEPAIRFVYPRSNRTQSLLEYCDAVYALACTKIPERKETLFLYGLFIKSFLKNRIKSQITMKRAKMVKQGIFVRFQIDSITKSEMGDKDASMNETMELSVKSQLEQAENSREDARDAQIAFFENLSQKHPNFSLLHKQLSTIVSKEEAAKRQYETLLAQNTSSVPVLRSYGELLRTILRDVDMSEYVLNKADQIEEDCSETGVERLTGTLHTSGTEGQLVRSESKGNISRKKRKKKKKKKKLEEDANATLLNQQFDVRTRHISISICASILLHLIGVSGVVSSGIVIHVTSADYVDSLSSLEQVGSMLGNGMRLAIITQELLIHHYNLTWSMMGSNGMKIDDVQYILDYCLDYPQRMADSMKTLLNRNENYQVWEVVDVDTISVDVANNRISKVYEAHTSFMTLSTEIINTVTKLGHVPIDDIPTSFEQFIPDVLALQYNILQPFVESGKRLLVSYTQTAEQEGMLLETLLVIVCSTSIWILIIGLIITYSANVIFQRKTRRALLRDSLEIPKKEIHSILRMLNEEDQDESMVENDEDGEEEAESESSESQVLEHMSEDEVKNDISSDPPIDQISLPGSPSGKIQRNKTPLNPTRSALASESEVADDLNISEFRKGEYEKDVQSPHRTSKHKMNLINQTIASSGLLLNSHTSSIHNLMEHRKSAAPPPPAIVADDTCSFSSLICDADKDEDNEHVSKPRDDLEWEDKFENDVHQLGLQYKSFGSAFPSWLSALMASHIIVIFAVFLGFLIPLNTSATELTSLKDNMHIAVIREVAVYNCHYLLLRLAFHVPALELPSPMACKISTNPCWKGGKHLSADPEDIREITLLSFDYFRKVHLQAHFGITPLRVTKDDRVDSVKSDRYNQTFNEIALFTPGNCFLTEGNDCGSMLAMYRIYKQHNEMPGLQSLITKFLYYGEILRHEPLNTIDMSHPSYLFVTSAMRYDLRVAMSNMVLQMCEHSLEIQTSYVLTSWIMTAIFSVVFLVIMLSDLFIFKSLKNLANDDRRLEELVSGEGVIEHESVFVDAMKVETDAFNVGRKKMIELMNHLINAVEQKESGIKETIDEWIRSAVEEMKREEAVIAEVINKLKLTIQNSPSSDLPTPSTRNSLVVSPLRKVSSKAIGRSTFNLAQQDTLTHQKLIEYHNVLVDHRLGHRVLLQRMKLLGENVDAKEHERQRVALRYLQILFDTHFVNTDVETDRIISELKDSGVTTSSSPNLLIN